MARSIRIGRFFGIDVELHYSWFFIIALLASGLAQGFFPDYFPGLSSVEYWSMGIVSSILLFLSVLLHEFAHSLVAKRNNIGVHSITLFFFGGVASINEKGLNPQKELKMSIAGPIFSLFLGAFFWVILLISTNVYISAVSYYLFRINIILAAFNLVPGYPLDGGRVFRAIVWGITGDIRKATKYASNGGRYFAMFLMALGGVSIFSGNFGGLWFLLIGAFLYFIAKLSYEQIVIKDILGKVKVKQFMDKKYKTVDALLPLLKFADEYLLRYLQPSYPVILKGKFVGVAGLYNVERVPKREWPKFRVLDVMVSARRVGKSSPDENAYKAFSDMLSRNLSMLPVLKGEKFIGIVTRDSLLHFIRVKLELSGERIIIK